LFSKQFVNQLPHRVTTYKIIVQRLAQPKNPDIIDTSQQGNDMTKKTKEFLDLAFSMACIALPFVLYFAFVMKP
jgi:hypothetical protein